MRTTLRHMHENQEGEIVAINGGGELGRRLREMGLIPGMNVRIMGRAPLKDPVAVRIMGSTVSLRNGEADQIEVEVANI